jgi:hypothetical protein
LLWIKSDRKRGNEGNNSFFVSHLPDRLASYLNVNIPVNVLLMWYGTNNKSIHNLNVVNTASGISCTRLTAKYTRVDCKRNEDILEELKTNYVSKYERIQREGDSSNH